MSLHIPKAYVTVDEVQTPRLIKVNPSEVGKLIPLSRGRQAIIDAEDYELIRQYSWYYNNGYAKAYYKGQRIRMHRLIMSAKPGESIDHINRNRLDNRRANLRICTVQQNNRNVGLRKDNTSGYKGVYLDRTTGHWRPLVYINGKAIGGGQFIEKRHAALAHDLWAVFFYGEFAATNFTVVGSK